MGFLKNKRASEDVLSLTTVIEFILLLLVAGLIAMIIIRETNNDTFEKRFLAKDIAMFIDTLHASPNTILVRYPEDTFQYTYEFKKPKVTIYKENQKELSETFVFSMQKDIIFIDKKIAPADNVKIVDGSEDTNIPIIFIKTKRKIEPFSGLLVKE